MSFQLFTSQISQEIRRTMHSKGITSADLAALMNTSPDLVEGFLNKGYFINLLTLYDYAKALGCSPRFVLDDPQQSLPLVAAIERVDDRPLIGHIIPGAER